MMDRRRLVVGLGAGLVGGLVERAALASVVRAVPLPDLVRGSSAVLVLTVLDAESHFGDVGRRRRIVTDTRCRVEDVLAKGRGISSEVMVRTLGGTVGDLGEQVQGQARLGLGATCVEFLVKGSSDLHYVNAMAQGHYPLVERPARLTQSPDLGSIIDFEASAVRELVGRSLSDARARVQELAR
jgi:hypothetical protein